MPKGYRHLTYPKFSIFDKFDLVSSTLYIMRGSKARIAVV